MTKGALLMNKKKMLIFVFAALVLLFALYAVYLKFWKKPSFSTVSPYVITDTEKLSLEFSVELISDKRAELTITNNDSSNTREIQPPYSLEYLDDGVWYVVPFYEHDGITQIFSHDISSINPGGSFTQVVFLDEYVKHPSGHYRITKSVTIVGEILSDPDQGDGIRTDYRIAAEFDL